VSRYDYPDASDAEIAPLTEERLARLLADEGETVRQANGRWWREYSRGFYEPVHRLAPLSRAEARRPGVCWGYRATLRPEDAGAANAVLPVHLSTDLASHDESVLPSDSRKDFRRQARLGIRIVQATDLAVLRDQAYEVLTDWWGRMPRRGKAPTQERFLSDLEARTIEDGWLNLAALEGDTLLGFSHSRVVDGIAYLEIQMVSREALAIGLSSRLDFEAIQVYRRTGAASIATSGIHQPEMPGLAAYKIRQGFPVIGVPSRFWMAPPLDLLVRRRRPLTYYRLSGRAIDRAIAWAHEDPAQPRFDD
jgi:hypothetical protein